MSLWDKVQASARKASEKAGAAAHKAKLRTDMLLIDREIQSRKKKFGIAMFDHISPLSQSQDFYAANDDLTNMVRPHLLNAQKEIQALAAKRVKLKESLAKAEADRAAAFPKQAESVGGKLLNFGKAGAMHSMETKIKAELAILEQKIKGHKQAFGIVMFEDFAHAEDNRGYLPTDRQVRNIYDTCRSDIQRMEANKAQKMEEFKTWGGSAEDTTTPSVVENSNAGFGSNAHPNDLNMQSSYAAPTANTGYAAPSANTGYSAPTANTGRYADSDDLLL